MCSLLRELEYTNEYVKNNFRRKDQRPERSGGRRALRRTEQDPCRSVSGGTRACEVTKGDKGVCA